MLCTSSYLEKAIFWAWTDNICHMACILTFDSLKRYGMQLFCPILGVGEKDCCLVLQNVLICAPASVTIHVNCLGGGRTTALSRTRQNSSNLFEPFIRKISRVIVSCSSAKPCRKSGKNSRNISMKLVLLLVSGVALDRKHLLLICLWFGGRCGLKVDIKRHDDARKCCTHKKIASLDGCVLSWQSTSFSVKGWSPSTLLLDVTFSCSLAKACWKSLSS